MKKLLLLPALISLSTSTFALTQTCAPIIYCNAQKMCTNIPNDWKLVYFNGDGDYHLQNVYYQLPYINGYIGDHGITVLPNSIACLYSHYTSQGQRREILLSAIHNGPSWFADVPSNTGWNASVVKDKRGVCNAPNVCQFTTVVPTT